MRVDPYIVAILLVAGVAVILPARGDSAVAMDHAVKVAIGLLFFLYGRACRRGRPGRECGTGVCTW